MDALPDELWLLVLSHCDGASLRAVVSKRWLRVARDRTLAACRRFSFAPSTRYSAIVSVLLAWRHCRRVQLTPLQYRDLLASTPPLALVVDDVALVPPPSHRRDRAATCAAEATYAALAALLQNSRQPFVNGILALSVDFNAVNVSFPWHSMVAVVAAHRRVQRLTFRLDVDDGGSVHEYAYSPMPICARDWLAMLDGGHVVDLHVHVRGGRIVYLWRTDVRRVVATQPLAFGRIRRVAFTDTYRCGSKAINGSRAARVTEWLTSSAFCAATDVTLGCDVIAQLSLWNNRGDEDDDGEALTPLRPLESLRLAFSLGPALHLDVLRNVRRLTLSVPCDWRPYGVAPMALEELTVTANASSPSSSWWIRLAPLLTQCQRLRVLTLPDSIKVVDAHSERLRTALRLHPTLQRARWRGVVETFSGAEPRVSRVLLLHHAR